MANLAPVGAGKGLIGFVWRRTMPIIHTGCIVRGRADLSVPDAKKVNGITYPSPKCLRLIHRQRGNIEQTDLIKPLFIDKGAAYQLNTFNAAKPSYNPSTSLFMVWLFPNDVLSWLNSNSYDAGSVLGGAPKKTPPAGLIENGITNIDTLIQVLALDGATQFLVPNMPDLAQTPLFRNYPPAFRSFLTELTVSFNTQLDPVLQNLDASLPGVEITRFQIDDLLAKVIDNPSNYGFENVSDACLNISLSTICSNPSQWLFWDDFHPTTAGQRLIAENFYTSVVPGPLPLAGVTVAFGWSRRLRRRVKRSAA